MICFFVHAPCQFIKCQLWGERRQACRFVLAIDKILDQEPPRAQLTPGEQKILELMTQGYSNPQISAALSLCTGTVKNHVSRVLAKMGVSSRTEAVIKNLTSKKEAK